MKGKTLALRLLQLALIVVVTWGIVRALAPDLAKVSWQDFAAFDPSITRLLAATLLLIGFYLLHAQLWRTITMALGREELAWRSALHIYFLSGLGRYIPGKLWQVAGMALLAQRAGISAVAATAAAIVAQLAFITSGLIYLALVLPAWGGLAPIFVAMAGVLLAATVYRGRHWLALKINKLRPAVAMIDRITVRDALQWWLVYGVSWIILGAAFVLFTSAFATLDFTAQRHVAGTVAAAYLGGLLAFFSIAGLGVREALMGSLLVTVMPAPAALVVSVASRVWFTMGELIPILFAKANARSRHHPDV